MPPAVRTTTIPGLLVVDLAVHPDARGWFKENWQRAKMTALGLPDFGPVQHSVAFNEAVGVTRGVHAEPWDKLVSVGSGRAFGAWVDLRAGETFGAVHTEVLDPSTAVFVPRGVGNSYQTLTEGVVYSYLVNDHWSPDASYTMLNLADETVAISWPIPLERALVSDKDLAHPRLAEVEPVAGPTTLILGRSGQVATALRDAFPQARALGRDEVDLADPQDVAELDLRGVGAVINAAAWTAVDAAETSEGRTGAWALNATGVAALARAVSEAGSTLVHYSSDYVFDGGAGAATEQTPLSPLGVYGQSKAAGELAVQHVPQHYLLRTSWVVGRGSNFVATMARLADRGVHPRVVDDQVGRLTFADELAAATRHLLETRAAYGTYHVTGGGTPCSWAELAVRVFELRGRSASDVTRVTTQEYLADTPHRTIAPRPACSVLDLSRLEATGFTPRDHLASLADYLEDWTGAE